MTMFHNEGGPRYQMLLFIDTWMHGVRLHFPRNGRNLGSGGHAVAAAAACVEDIKDAENDTQQRY